MTHCNYAKAYTVEPDSSSDFRLDPDRNVPATDPQRLKIILAEPLVVKFLVICLAEAVLRDVVGHGHDETHRRGRRVQVG